MHWVQLRTVIAGGGGWLLLWLSVPAAYGEFCTRGTGAGYNTEWETLCCPAGGKVAQGKQGESLAPLEHSAPASSQWVRQVL